MIEIELQEKLRHILNESPLFRSIFSLADKIDLSDWYIAGGCVTQTVWNSLENFDPWHGLKDVDLVYFDATHSEEDEEFQRKKIQNIFRDLPIPFDIINEARVHEWYPAKFGYEIQPYESTEDGISTWLPAFSIGIRPELKNLKIIAPFGLQDTFNMVVRPNKRQINEAIYKKMVARLQKDWPNIESFPWT